MLTSLQLARAFAALAVVAFHLSRVMGSAEFNHFPVGQQFTSLGYLGVDFFFSLSGFIILAAHYSDLGRPERLRAYLIKRVIRIYPLYWIITGILLVGAICTQGVTPVPAGFMDIASTMTLLHLNDFRPPLPPAWTLFHEILFYALMAFAIRNIWLGIAALVIWLGVLVCFNMGVFAWPESSSALVKTFAMPVNIAFFGGLFAYFIYRKISLFQAKALFLLGLIELVVLLEFSLPGNDVFLYKVYLAFANASIIAGIAGMERNGMSFNMPLLPAIGHASFMLYLTHSSIQNWALKLFYWLMPDYAAQYPKLIYLLVMLVCIVFALAAYRWFEKPLLRFLRNKILPPGRQAAPQAGYAMRG